MRRPYAQLTLDDRKNIEEGIDRGLSFRRIAELMGRSASTVSREVRARRARRKERAYEHRHCGARLSCEMKGICEKGCPYEGEHLCSECERVRCTDVCERYGKHSLCERLNRAPWVCNGCARTAWCRRKGAERWVYDARLADASAKEERSSSRRGIDMGPEEAERVLAAIRAGLAQRPSPYEISVVHRDEVSVSPSTIYRWIEAGYGEMANIELERKVGFRKRRRKGSQRIPTRHTARRSHDAFLALPEEKRCARWETDTVIGRAANDQCVPTLYHVPTKLQLGLLLPEKTVDAVVGALEAMSRAVGKEAFGRMFALVLTDNGAEFANEARLARAFGERKGGASRLFHCDVRASEQKGSCEKNHVELRQILPKGRWTSTPSGPETSPSRCRTSTPRRGSPCAARARSPCSRPCSTKRAAPFWMPSAWRRWQERTSCSGETS